MPNFTVSEARDLMSSRIFYQHTNQTDLAYEALQVAQVISGICTADALGRIADSLDGILCALQDINRAAGRG